VVRPAERELLRRVGRRVAELRAASGLTQEALATALGIATKNLQRLEGGTQNLTLVSLAGVARQLGVDVLDLLRAPTDSPPRRAARTSWLSGLAELGVDVSDWEVPGAIPVTTLVAAAGGLGEGRVVEARAWALLPDRRAKPEPGSFLARVVGGSMEPRVPDGAWCVFRAPASAARGDGVALVAVRDPGDDAARYLVKRVEKTRGRRGIVTLASLAPGFAPIELEAARAEVLADLVRVVGPR
jgi:hypothetical protein